MKPSRGPPEHIRKVEENARRLLVYLEEETAFQPMVRTIRRIGASRRLFRLYIQSTGPCESPGRVGRQTSSSPLAITTASQSLVRHQPDPGTIDKITALQAHLDELWSQERRWRADVSSLRKALQRDSILPDGNVNRQEFEEQVVILESQLSEIPMTRHAIQMQLHRVVKRHGMDAGLRSGRLAW